MESHTSISLLIFRIAFLKIVVNDIVKQSHNSIFFNDKNFVGEYFKKQNKQTSNKNELTQIRHQMTSC